MNFRQLNRDKNLLIRRIKSRLIKLLVDYKTPSQFTTEQIKKIIFLRNDNKLGDMIVSTMSFREAKQAGLQVHVIAAENTAPLLTPNTDVDQIYTYKKGIINTIKLGLALRKQHFDLLIDIGDDPRAETLFLIAIMAPKHLLGFNKNDYKLYDLSLTDNVEDKHHITYRHQTSLAKLGIEPISTKYSLPIPQHIDDEVTAYLTGLNKKVIVVNLFTASKHRDMSLEQITDVVATLGKEFKELAFILIGTPDRIKDITIEGVKNSPFNSLFHSIALIKHADIILSPDTAIVHIAQAFDKPLVALYLANDIETTKWRVCYDNAHLLFTNDCFTDVSKLESKLIINQLVKLVKNNIDTDQYLNVLKK